MGLSDIEDLQGSSCGPVVACPVHAFTFDLRTGHCISNHKKDGRLGTPPGLVFSARQERAGEISLFTEPLPPQPNRVAQADGFAAQLELVRIGLDRKYGKECD